MKKNTREPYEYLQKAQWIFHKNVKDISTSYEYEVAYYTHSVHYLDYVKQQ